jgi:RNA 3'-terminal phosphate cyclase (ATP)
VGAVLARESRVDCTATACIEIDFNRGVATLRRQVGELTGSRSVRGRDAINAPMLTIDGSIGEGGGQILRTALSLAICEQRAFKIVNIRGQRPKPGLRPQHLAAVRAAAQICSASVEGDAIGSRALTFIPGRVEPGNYLFSIGTAGSASLVLQTVLPALLTAERSSELRLEGGTHNPRAPTFECLARAYLPLIERMGPRVGIELERPGFEPAGGGALRASIEPVHRLAPLHLTERGAVLRIEAEILLSKLPRHIAEREAAVLAEMLHLSDATIARRVVGGSPGPGNVVTVVTTCDRVTEVSVGFGRRGVPAEHVARGVAESVQRYLATSAPVGVHLADQLLLPLALAGSGSFVTVQPTEHTLTNSRVIREFLPVEIRCGTVAGGNTWRIEIQDR